MSFWIDQYGRTAEEVLIQFRKEQVERARLKATKYDNSEHGQLKKAEWRISELGAASMRRRARSEAGKATATRYLSSPQGQAMRARVRVARHQDGREQRRLDLYRERDDVVLKMLAREAIGTKLRHGTWIRPATCSLLEPRNDYHGGRIEAHHFLGYALEHWLDIQWVCLRCHRVLH